jgi:hypothetical protein
MVMMRRKAMAVIVSVGLLVGGLWASAQVRGIESGPDGLNLVAPTVIAGNDLGFRVESTKNGIALGTLVVRINGHWTDAQVGSNGVITTSAAK